MGKKVNSYSRKIKKNGSISGKLAGLWVKAMEKTIISLIEYL